jgi:5-formyltetrahydrofolate cyclo-ligase
MTKAVLRNKHKDLRLNVDPVYLEAASLRLQEKAWEIIKDVSSVGLYISMDYEVSTRTLFQRCLDNHKILCVPKIVGNQMIFIQIKDLSECSKSPYGILEPSSNEAYKGKIDVQIIPMLAFNQRHFRLGYGKGYYDTYLINYTGLKCGLCFSMDEDVDLIESDHDIACDMILTEI